MNIQNTNLFKLCNNNILPHYYFLFNTFEIQL